MHASDQERDILEGFETVVTKIGLIILGLEGDLFVICDKNAHGYITSWVLNKKIVTNYIKWNN